MSHKATIWARVQRLHRTPKTVLMYLAERANERDGYYCFPGQKLIARETGISERTVRLAMGYLEEMGFIDREQRRRKDGYRTSDTVTVLVSDAEIAVQPYGEWYAHRTNGKDSHRQVLHTSPAGPAGPFMNQKGNQKHELQADAELEAATSSAHSEFSDRVLARVVDEITRSIPGMSDEAVMENYLRVLEADEECDAQSSEVVRSANARMRDTLALEAASRVGGVS